jgi:predicted AAA+ superfamily ATPase
MHPGRPPARGPTGAQAAREAARSDPEGFIAGLKRPVLIDEVQRGGPDLLLAIKSVVDKDQTSGQFFLTGSANVLAARKVLDALTGRVESVTLWPLTQSEIEGTEGNFIDSLFAGAPPQVEDAPVGREALVGRLAAGGYPEALLRTEARRTRWFDSYLESTLERDLTDISDAWNFVAMETLRHAEWSGKAPKPFHYRQGRDEIDVVLEDRAGNVAAVEVKASASGPHARLAGPRTNHFLDASARRRWRDLSFDEERYQAPGASRAKILP